MKSNIILTGMPGVGKSTVGVVLAKRLGYHFLDSDLLIQEKYGKLLHEIIAERGNGGFLQVECEVNAAIVTTSTVIATGGSAVYGKEAMRHFSEIGIVIYLQLTYKAIAERLGDLNKRGVAFQSGQTLKHLYEERVPLYEKYADIVIACEDKSIREIVMEISKKIEGQENPNDKE